MKAVKYAALALALAVSCGTQAEEVIYDTYGAQRAAKSIYDQKYLAAQTTLERCVSARHVEPTLRSLGHNRFEYVPHAAVKHAAEVDQPVRAPGRDPSPKLCEYIKQPQVTQWYKQNFKL